jgi:FixJ family two-component response regulator
MLANDPRIILVEDEQQMRESLIWMLRSTGYEVDAHAAPTSLLESYDPDTPGCLVLDLRLPEMNGLELVAQLRQKGGNHPFIMITGHGDVPVAVDSMKQGAVDFLSKPFSHRIFLNRVKEALDRDTKDRQRRKEEAIIQKRIDLLTPREREVMHLVVDGLLTKQIATELGIKNKTVEVHRSHVTRKMQVESVPQLVRMVALRRLS